MQKLIRYHIQLRGDTLLVAQRRAHRCTADASDPVIATLMPDAFPRPSNHVPKHISACGLDRKFVEHERQIGVQDAAKKKQSISSSNVLRVLRSPQMKLALRIGVLAAAGCVVAMLIWQAVTAQGAPDPLRPDTSPTVAFLDIGILVFREGLECILVLAAITASMTGPKRGHRRPVAFGAAFAFVATLITWFVAVRIVGSLSDNMSALDLQAAPGF